MMRTGISFTLIFFSLLIFTKSQEIIKEVELEDFYKENRLYPYTVASPNGTQLYQRHDPSLRISENEFVHLIRPENHDSELRALVKYNLLLNEEWKVEFEVSDDEEIVDLFFSGNKIRVLSEEYKRQEDEHLVLIRNFDLETGEEEDIQIIQTVEGKWENTPIPVFSPNDSLILLYHYRSGNKFRRTRFMFDFENSNFTPGFRALRATHIPFKVLDLDFNEIARDTFWLAPNSKNKHSNFGCYLDNSGNVYNLSVSRDQVLRVDQRNIKDGEMNRLEYIDFPRFWLEDEEDFSHFPPLIGEDERVYLGLGQKGRNRGFGWRINNYQVICFDFKGEEVDLSRNVKISSSIIVDISKAREDARMKPLTKLDDYIITELKELPDGGLLLITQKYEDYDNDRFFYTPFDLNNSNLHLPSTNLVLEEIVIYQFDPLGNLFRTITIPSTQRVKVLTELMGHFYTSYLDWDNLKLHFLVHENDGEKYSDPMRLFYRSVDLQSGEVEERKQVFDHKRRNHYFARAHTVWLNSSVATLMMHVNTGITTRTYLLSLNLGN